MVRKDDKSGGHLRADDLLTPRAAGETMDDLDDCEATTKASSTGSRGSSKGL